LGTLVDSFRKIEELRRLISRRPTTGSMATFALLSVTSLFSLIACRSERPPAAPPLPAKASAPSPGTGSSVDPAHTGVLRFAVTGSCTTAGGSLGHTSSGFTPKAKFTVTATYPNGTTYPLAKTTGYANADGSVPWSWPCAGDPAGTYTTVLTDTTTHRTTGPVHFTIQPAPRGGPRDGQKLESR
jgi:hypothetical protein